MPDMIRPSIYVSEKYDILHLSHRPMLRSMLCWRIAGRAINIADIMPMFHWRNRVRARVTMLPTESRCQLYACQNWN